MKCIKATANMADYDKGDVIRVSNEEAQQLVNHRAWHYCPKHEWKKQEASRDR